MRAILLGLAVLSAPAFGGVHQQAATEDCCALNLWTGEGVSIGSWLLPEINYQMAVGSSTINPARLAVGHHDPDRHGITHQNLEFSLTALVNNHISFFGTYATKLDLHDHWISEFEEYYMNLRNLPGGLSIRAGRFQVRAGYQNELHVHDFNFVDQYLVNARMFGEDPLVIRGAEASFPVARSLPKGWEDRLTVSFGSVPEQEEEEHVEFGPEGPFEGERSLFADWAATANYRLGYAASESTRYEIGISGTWGENEFGRHSQVYGLHFEYLWKPGCGDHAAHGHHHDHSHGEAAEFFRWRTEIFTRRFGVISGHSEEEEEHEEHGTGEGAEEEEGAARRRDEFMDMGFYSAMSYGFPSGKLQAHLRAEYVTGVSEAALPERWRISPALTWRPTHRLPVYFKVQYNYDHAPSFGSEHSVWAQFNVTWGDCCAH